MFQRTERTTRSKRSRKTIIGKAQAVTPKSSKKARKVKERRKSDKGKEVADGSGAERRSQSNNSKILNDVDYSKLFSKKNKGFQNFSSMAQQKAKFYDEKSLKNIQFQNQHSRKNIEKRASLAENDAAGLAKSISRPYTPEYQIDHPHMFDLKPSGSKYPNIEMFFSAKNIAIRKSYQLVIEINGERWDTEFTRRQNWKFRNAVNTEFIFQKMQKVVVKAQDDSKRLLGTASFEIGELVGSEHNCLFLELYGGRLGNTTRMAMLQEVAELSKKPKIKVMFSTLVPELFGINQNQEGHQIEFMDFLRGNLKISLICCIDFTASNVYNPSGRSLHELYEGRLNEYQSAIAAVSSVLLNYDSDKMVPVYGFGAVPLDKQFEHLEAPEERVARMDSNIFSRRGSMMSQKDGSKSKDSYTKRPTLKQKYTYYDGSEESKDQGSRDSMSPEKGRSMKHSPLVNGRRKSVIPPHLIKEIEQNKRKKTRNSKSKKPAVSHFFPVSGSWTECAGVGIEGVFEIYNKAVSQLRFKMSGPTLFSPLLDQVNLFTEETHKEDKYTYTVLLILTDGVIHDMDETIAELIRGSTLPLSVIIVGIGYEDFTEMDILDSDRHALKDKEGNVSLRDIVQFVDYSEYSGEKKKFSKLAEQVLKEIPSQVCSFFKMKSIVPRRPKKKKMTQFEHQMNTLTHNLFRPEVVIEEVAESEVQSNALSDEVIKRKKSRHNSQKKSLMSKGSRLPVSVYSREEDYDDSIVNDGAEKSNRSMVLGKDFMKNTILTPELSKRSRFNDNNGGLTVDNQIRQLDTLDSRWSYCIPVETHRSGGILVREFKAEKTISRLNEEFNTRCLN